MQAFMDEPCAAGREITREDGLPYLGLDFTTPCSHPAPLIVLVDEDGLLHFCQCHFDAIHQTGIITEVG